MPVGQPRSMLRSRLFGRRELVRSSDRGTIGEIGGIERFACFNRQKGGG